MASYPNVNAANQYARDIVGGKILACQLTILACKRHLDDLERAKNPNWPYRFDKNKAERFLRFAQKMPHTAGEWARRKLRIEFEPWQKFALGVPFGWVNKKVACGGSLRSISKFLERTANQQLLLPLAIICSALTVNMVRKCTAGPRPKSRPGKCLLRRC